MGMYGGSSDAGSDLRAQQTAQQANIATGMTDINAVFGGTSGVNPVTDWKQGTQYYDQFGQPIPMGVAPPQGQFFSGTQTTGGFNDAFYNKRTQDYENYALPQLESQYQKTLGNTTYGLARNGLLQSGAADYLSRGLQTEMVNQKQNIANTGIAQSQSLESNVNQQKNQIVAQLQSSADPATAAQQATAAASQFSAPSAFQPLGNAFANWQNMYLTNQLSNAYAPVVQAQNSGQGYNAPSAYTTPSFGAPLGSASSIR